MLSTSRMQHNILYTTNTAVILAARVNNVPDRVVTILVVTIQN